VAAAALQPAVPVFTFCLAVALGTERLALRRRDGWVTLAGIAVCVAGALATGALAPLRMCACAYICGSR
jgi:hypothetical protein